MKIIFGEQFKMDLQDPKQILEIPDYSYFVGLNINQITEENLLKLVANPVKCNLQSIWDMNVECLKLSFDFEKSEERNKIQSSILGTNDNRYSYIQVVYKRKDDKKEYVAFVLGEFERSDNIINILDSNLNLTKNLVDINLSSILIVESTLKTALSENNDFLERNNIDIGTSVFLVNKHNLSIEEQKNTTVIKDSYYKYLNRSACKEDTSLAIPSREFLTTNDGEKIYRNLNYRVYNKNLFLPRLTGDVSILKSGTTITERPTVKPNTGGGNNYEDLEEATTTTTTTTTDEPHQSNPSNSSSTTTTTKIPIPTPAPEPDKTTTTTTKAEEDNENTSSAPPEVPLLFSLKRAAIDNSTSDNTTTNSYGSTTTSTTTTKEPSSDTIIEYNSLGLRSNGGRIDVSGIIGYTEHNIKNNIITSKSVGYDSLVNIPNLRVTTEKVLKPGTYSEYYNEIWPDGIDGYVNGKSIIYPPLGVEEEVRCNYINIQLDSIDHLGNLVSCKKQFKLTQSKNFDTPWNLEWTTYSYDLESPYYKSSEKINTGNGIVQEEIPVIIFKPGTTREETSCQIFLNNPKLADYIKRYKIEISYEFLPGYETETIESAEEIFNKFFSIEESEDNNIDNGYLDYTVSCKSDLEIFSDLSVPRKDRWLPYDNPTDYNTSSDQQKQLIIKINLSLTLPADSELLNGSNYYCSSFILVKEPVHRRTIKLCKRTEESESWETRWEELDKIISLGESEFGDFRSEELRVETDDYESIGKEELNSFWIIKNNNSVSDLKVIDNLDSKENILGGGMNPPIPEYIQFGTSVNQIYLVSDATNRYNYYPVTLSYLDGNIFNPSDTAEINDIIPNLDIYSWKTLILCPSLTFDVVKKNEVKINCLRSGYIDDDNITVDFTGNITKSIILQENIETIPFKVSTTVPISIFIEATFNGLDVSLVDKDNNIPGDLNIGEHYLSIITRKFPSGVGIEGAVGRLVIKRVVDNVEEIIPIELSTTSRGIDNIEEGYNEYNTVFLTGFDEEGNSIVRDNIDTTFLINSPNTDSLNVNSIEVDVVDEFLKLDNSLIIHVCDQDYGVTWDSITQAPEFEILQKLVNEKYLDYGGTKITIPVNLENGSILQTRKKYPLVKPAIQFKVNNKANLYIFKEGIFPYFYDSNDFPVNKINLNLLDEDLTGETNLATLNIKSEYPLRNVSDFIKLITASSIFDSNVSIQVNRVSPEESNYYNSNEKLDYVINISGLRKVIPPGAGMKNKIGLGNYSLNQEISKLTINPSDFGNSFVKSNSLELGLYFMPSEKFSSLYDNDKDVTYSLRDNSINITKEFTLEPISFLGGIRSFTFDKPHNWYLDLGLLRLRTGSGSATTVPNAITSIDKSKTTSNSSIPFNINIPENNNIVELVNDLTGPIPIDTISEELCNDLTSSSNYYFDIILDKYLVVESVEVKYKSRFNITREGLTSCAFLKYEGGNSGLVYLKPTTSDDLITINLLPGNNEFGITCLLNVPISSLYKYNNGDIIYGESSGIIMPTIIPEGYKSTDILFTQKGFAGIDLYAPFDVTIKLPPNFSSKELIWGFEIYNYFINSHIQFNLVQPQEDIVIKVEGIELTEGDNQTILGFHSSGYCSSSKKGFGLFEIELDIDKFLNPITQELILVDSYSNKNIPHYVEVLENTCIVRATIDSNNTRELKEGSIILSTLDQNQSWSIGYKQGYLTAIAKYQNRDDKVYGIGNVGSEIYPIISMDNVSNYLNYYTINVLQNEIIYENGNITFNLDNELVISCSNNDLTKSLARIEDYGHYSIVTYQTKSWSSNTEKYFQTGYDTDLYYINQINNDSYPRLVHNYKVRDIYQGEEFKFNTEVKICIDQYKKYPYLLGNSGDNLITNVQNFETTPLYFSFWIKKSNNLPVELSKDYTLLNWENSEDEISIITIESDEYSFNPQEDLTITTSDRWIKAEIISVEGNYILKIITDNNPNLVNRSGNVKLLPKDTKKWDGHKVINVKQLSVPYSWGDDFTNSTVGFEGNTIRYQLQRGSSWVESGYSFGIQENSNIKIKHNSLGTIIDVTILPHTDTYSKEISLNFFVKNSVGDIIEEKIIKITQIGRQVIKLSSDIPAEIIFNDNPKTTTFIGTNEIEKYFNKGDILKIKVSEYDIQKYKLIKFEITPEGGTQTLYDPINGTDLAVTISGNASIKLKFEEVTNNTTTKPEAGGGVESNPEPNLP